MKRIYLFLVFFILNISIFGEENISAVNANKYGAITLIPPLVAIILAFITKEVVLSLFIGIFSGTFILAIGNGNGFYSFVSSFLDVGNRILASLADSWNAGVILQVLIIGGLIALISRMGGAKAIAETLSKRAKSPVSAQVISWFLGILIFFDDYANALIIGPIMRPITDKLRISREKLSFIIDATAAPIAGIALISTWVGTEVSLIQSGLTEIGQTSITGYGVFLSTIPFRFYNIFMLVFVLASALLLRDFGPMYHAEKRARETGDVFHPHSKPMIHAESSSMMPKHDIPLRSLNALIPILTLCFSAFIGFYVNGRNTLGISYAEYDKTLLRYIIDCFGNADASLVLFQAALFASVVTIILAVSQKLLTFVESVETWVHGVKSLIITAIILLLAWSLSSVIKELGTAQYITKILENSLPPFLLPTLIFIIASIIAFATGTSYGTMGILMPLAIPLAASLDPNLNFLTITIGSVLTGAIVGDHCSPISDTTILSSMGAGSDHIDHVKTQLPYALVVTAISVIFGYIPAALGLHWSLCLTLGILAVIASLLIFGKSVKDIKPLNNLENDIN